MKSFDLNEDATQFKIATTDSGLCQVLNGNTMRNTYMATSRISELWSNLEIQTESKPEMIRGAGKSYQKVMWLNLGDKYVKRVQLMSYV